MAKNCGSCQKKTFLYKGKKYSKEQIEAMRAKKPKTAPPAPPKPKKKIVKIVKKVKDTEGAKPKKKIVKIVKKVEEKPKKKIVKIVKKVEEKPKPKKKIVKKVVKKVGESDFIKIISPMVKEYYKKKAKAEADDDVIQENKINDDYRDAFSNLLHKKKLIKEYKKNLSHPAYQQQTPDITNLKPAIRDEILGKVKSKNDRGEAKPPVKKPVKKVVKKVIKKVKEAPKPKKKIDNDIDYDSEAEDEANEEQNIEIDEMTERITSIYEKKKLKYPVPFECNNFLWRFYYTYIMKRNKNDCVFGKYFRIAVGHLGDSTNSEDYKKLTLETAEMGGPHSINAFSKTKEIAEKYLECASRGKMLCFGIVHTSHANMLVFNYHRNEVERFEPHGQFHSTSLYSDKDAKIMNQTFKRWVSDISKHLPKKDKLKYIAPGDICPRPSGWQSYEKIDMQTGTKYIDEYFPEGLIVKKDDGYCCVYALLFCDMRLKNPKLSGRELDEAIVKKMKATKNKIVKEMARGLTADFYGSMIKYLKKKKVPPEYIRNLVATMFTGVSLDEKYMGKIPPLLNKLNKWMDKNLYDALEH